jgi:hypothetical protein
VELPNEIAPSNNQLSSEYLEANYSFTLWRLFFTSQSAVGRLRVLELATIGVTPEQSGALFLLSRNKGKSTITEMADAGCDNEIRFPH